MSFDEMYDEMLHDEFRAGTSRGAHATKGPVTGLARYRTAALVVAGGLATATAGAFLGGLGGYFTLSPASAHSITSSSSEAVPLAAAANAAFHTQALAAAAPAAGAGAAVTETKSYLTNSAHGAAEATFAAAVGPLLNGIAPVQAPTADLPVTAPVTSSTTTDGSTPGASSPTALITGSLSNILGGLTSALTSLASLPGNPTGAITGVITPLTGVLTDVTGTLADLSSLMPLSGAGAGSLPVLLAGSPLTGVLSAAGPSVNAPKNSTPSSAATALTPILSSVAAAVTDATGSGLPTLPSLPLPSASGTPAAVPSLPVTTAAGALPTLPVISLPSVPGVISSSGGSSTVTLPVPLPLPSTTLNLGIVSVGINTAGGSTAATISGLL